MFLKTKIDGKEDGGEKMWQSLVRQNELVAQLCRVMRDIKNVKGGTQKKIEKLRQLLSGLLSELTYFDEVCNYFYFHVYVRKNAQNMLLFLFFAPNAVVSLLSSNLCAI